jgi:hypothetical protein
MRVLRNAEIIAVGSELLTPHRIDTNSLFLTGRLNEMGIVVRARPSRAMTAAIWRRSSAVRSTGPTW